jgi:hypothetical protein
VGSAVSGSTSGGLGVDDARQGRHERPGLLCDITHERRRLGRPKALRQPLARHVGRDAGVARENGLELELGLVEGRGPRHDRRRLVDGGHEPQRRDEGPASAVRLALAHDARQLRIDEDELG